MSCKRCAGKAIPNYSGYIEREMEHELKRRPTADELRDRFIEVMLAEREAT